MADLEISPAITPVHIGLTALSGAPIVSAPRLVPARWQLLARSLADGYMRELTAATGRKLTAKLNDSSELSFAVDGRHGDALILDELAADVHVNYRNERGYWRLMRGRVGGTQDTVEADKHSMSVAVLDYRAVLKRRFLEPGDTLTFAGVDQAEIAWTLIAEAQAKAGGHLGIVKGWTGTTPTGQLRDRTYEVGDNIGDRIQELSEVIDGFDYDFVPVSQSALAFQVWSQRGTDRGVVLEYGGAVQKVSRTVDTGNYGNAIRYTGADALVAQQLTAPDVATAPQGRWGAVFGDTNLTTQEALNERAAWQLAQSQVLQPSYSLTLKRGRWWGPDHIWLGDPVRLIVKSGRLNVDTKLRVLEIGIPLEGGEEQVEITVGAPKPDFRRRPSEVQKRLTKLERR